MRSHAQAYEGSIRSDAGVRSSRDRRLLGVTALVLLFVPLFATSAFAAAPMAETTGSPIRSMTTAQLNGRANPEGSSATYYFEYGNQGPCDANPCTATTAHPAGAGSLIELVTQEVTGLDPGTTYHYRVVVDNGTVSNGDDMTVTTRSSEAPLSHGRFPGPPESDRAWEQVNEPDTGGNPVAAGVGMSDSGNRAVYEVKGGAPNSPAGSTHNLLFAERTPSGWVTKAFFPPRSEANAANWQQPVGDRELSQFELLNWSFTGAEPSSWRMYPDKPATEIFRFPSAEWTNFVGVSEDTSRVIWGLRGTQDPAHPDSSFFGQLYDVSSGTPKFVSAMPDGSVPSCGVTGFPSLIEETQKRHFVSADGSLLFFGTQGNNCSGPLLLYARDLEAGVTTAMTPPPISGTECDAYFIKSTPGAAFFTTASRLVAEDTDPAGCTVNQDVYRFDLEDGALTCVTCVVPGTDANVFFGFDHLNEKINKEIGVSEDGSRVYFSSNSELVAGAPSLGIYVVRVETGDFAYVAPSGDPAWAGDDAGRGNALNLDGSVFILSSDSPALNALGGQNNGGTRQHYRYDDEDRSLICVSCPQDGSAPTAAVKGGRGDGLAIETTQVGPNTVPVDQAGDFVFATPTSLVPSDQNTAPRDPYTGSDLYEWRDGRTLLVTDGLTNWPENPASGEVESPQSSGITPSGRDIFFTAPIQYTQDALDGYRRLYDARIGGGFEFPRPPKPCPLEVCQGTPLGAPEEQAPGTAFLRGAQNAAPRVARCAKAKVRRKGRCVAKRRRHAKKPMKHTRANHNRRNSR